METLFESTYLGSAARVTPLTLECVTQAVKRVAPLSRIKRIAPGRPLIAGVNVEGGPFVWGEMVPVKLGQKAALVSAVIKAATHVPDVPTLVVQCLGGYGLPGVTEGSEYMLFFDHEEIAIHGETGYVLIPYSEITQIEFAGPGETSTNAGVIGGGFGLLGAVAGMALSSAVNAVTSQTRIDTILTWRTASSEVILHTSSATPDQLRIELSKQLGLIEQRGRGQAAASRDGLAAELQQLADLRSSGVLSDEEFTAAKARLLAG